MNKKTVGIIGIILACVFLSLGFFTKVPEKEISFFSSGDNGYEEYVGGDAYNIQIEASLRGGQIAGAKSAQAIYISAAGIVLLLSLLCLCKENEKPLKEENNTPSSTDPDTSVPMT